MRRSGFSLIETVLALGIVATVLMSVIGMLPQALDSTQHAERRAAEALIVANVRAQYASSLPVGELHFDAHGLPMTNETRDFAFIAKVTASDSIVLPGDPSGSLRTALLEISDRSRQWTHAQALTLTP